ncbi:hypothetical protein HAX54_010702 [Datura stramonium]|uniref:Secreted protein n=1 Tax=Datura stramonium TaxID=4076 RepID=A0ABS8TGR4_DATST|nr:hypothetical protein [Datura stramonium]
MFMLLTSIPRHKFVLLSLSLMDSASAKSSLLSPEADIQRTQYAFSILSSLNVLRNCADLISKYIMCSEL